VLAFLFLGAACGEGPAPPRPGPVAPAAAPPAQRFVGAARCAECHAAEAAAWRGSDHDRAMQAPSAEGVLGDFADARFTSHGEATTFSRRDDRYLVTTAGPDGKPAEFEVAYTFGADPLQQVLLPLPRGRLQALTVAWDARPKTAGGQRWYSLYPDEPTPPGDVLHWTQLSQSWNGGCADCHATNLRRGYDVASDAYQTTWSELDVACEACHGPGGAHVAWAEREPRDGEPALAVPLGAEPARWVLDAGAAIARREPPLREHTELEVCAPCHARRTLLREAEPGAVPFLDAYRPALLEQGLYEVDGQIREEVYEWGSFVQSRMYEAGVTCSDCHEPHALALRAEGNGLCGTCHAAAVFDAPSHHHHSAGSPGADCVACHMSARTYMGIDVRHDHSFRVPRPDLSAALGTPNACTDCHAKQPPRWAAEAVKHWFPRGRSGTPHFAEAFHAAADALPGAEAALVAVARDPALPAIVRATALTRIAAPDLPAGASAVRAGLADAEPLVRLGALEAARGLEPGARLAALLPLLADPLLAVRIEAARALAEVPPQLWRPADRSRLAAGLAEYRAAQRTNADRPEAHVNLAALDLVAGDVASARREYETALRLAPWFVPGYVNLADLYRATGDEAAAERALRQALTVAPALAEPHFALGLLLIRTGRRDEAFAQLSRAAELAPENPRFAQGLALALEDRGERQQAEATLARALARRPADRELLAAAAFLARERGDVAAARRHLEALLDAWPEDAAARELLASLGAS
jgi:Tfp pilus assembly protein PilF